MTTPGLDAVGEDGTRLRIEFPRCGDRFGQLISTIEPDGRQAPLLESVEGTARDAWPASPPLQSLSIETLAPGRRAALLVGMAGRSHWSASIEPVPGEAALVLDIACRTSEGSPSLGSLYRMIAANAWQVVLTAESRCAIHPGGEQQSVAVMPVEQSGPGTIRWKYKVSLARA